MAILRTGKKWATGTFYGSRGHALAVIACMVSACLQLLPKSSAPDHGIKNSSRASITGYTYLFYQTDQKRGQSEISSLVRRERNMFFCHPFPVTFAGGRCEQKIVVAWWLDCITCGQLCLVLEWIGFSTNVAVFSHTASWSHQMPLNQFESAVFPISSYLTDSLI